MEINVLGICGSLRAASFNRMLLRAASEVAPPGMSVAVFGLDGIPPYNADDQAVGFPEPVLALGAAISNADAVLFGTPEYNYSVPGVLKNALDWLSRMPDAPLQGKPASIIGASMGAFGTARAQYHLRQIAVFLDLHVLNRPEVMVARAQDKFDADGTLTDEPTREHLAKHMAALAEWVVRLRANP